MFVGISNNYWNMLNVVAFIAQQIQTNKTHKIHYCENSMKNIRGAWYSLFNLSNITKLSSGRTYAVSLPSMRFLTVHWIFTRHIPPLDYDYVSEVVQNFFLGLPRFLFGITGDKPESPSSLSMNGCILETWYLPIIYDGCEVFVKI